MDDLMSRHKAVKDACQAELSKQTKFIEKWQTVSEKNLSQEEQTMRLQLQRLHQDKIKYSQQALESTLNYDRTGRLHSDNHGIQMRRHSFSSRLPSITDKRNWDHKERLLESPLSKPRSHRQLKMDDHINRSLQSSSKTSHVKLPKIIKDAPIVIEDEKTKERRKPMLAGPVSKHKDRGGYKGKRHQSVPMIVLTDDVSNSIEDPFPNHTLKGRRHSNHSSQESQQSRDSHHGLNKSHQSHAHMEHRLSQHGLDRGHNRHKSMQVLERHNAATGSQQHVDHQHDHVDTDELTSLYDMAIQTVASTNEGTFTEIQDVHKRSRTNWMDESRIPDVKQMDLASLQELEHMLRDARQYNTRKQKETDYGLHTAENRQQRRRLQFLEEILQALSDTHAANFDPMDMLQCGYLRLSQSNIQRLENMVRESGRDPGIHAHSDVTQHDIWRELRQERLEQESKTTQSSFSGVK